MTLRPSRRVDNKCSYELLPSPTSKVEAHRLADVVLATPTAATRILNPATTDHAVISALIEPLSDKRLKCKHSMIFCNVDCAFKAKSVGNWDKSKSLRVMHSVIHEAVPSATGPWRACRSFMLVCRSGFRFGMSNIEIMLPNWASNQSLPIMVFGNHHKPCEKNRRRKKPMRSSLKYDELSPTADAAIGCACWPCRVLQGLFRASCSRPPTANQSFLGLPRRKRPTTGQLLALTQALLPPLRLAPKALANF